MPKTIAQTSARIKETYQRGQEALRKNNPEYAVELFLSILAMEPELDDLRKELRTAQIDGLKSKKPNPLSSMKGLGKTMAVKSALKKDPAKALIEAEELMKIDPLNQAFLDLYLEAAKAAGQPSAAAITFEAVLKVNRKNEALLEKLGLVYLDMKQPHEARRVFEMLGELRPSDQKVIKWIKDTSAMDSMEKGGWEKEGSFQDKLKNADEAAELEKAGRSQQNMNDMDKLIAKQRERLEAEPDNLNLYRPLADSLVKAGQFEEALDILERADDKANHADPMIQRAITDTTLRIYDYNIKVLTDEGDTEGAEAQRQEKQAYQLEDTAAKVKRYPNDLSFKFDYGELLYAKGDLDAAISQFQQAQRNPQRRIDALYLMGSCFKAKGQYDIAATQLQKAAEELPTMDDTKMAILYELGEVLEAQGDLDAALEHFKSIYAVDIGYKKVGEKIEAGYARKKKPSDA
ncbi:tetratricopeptide repeat protein [Kiritimatiellaeota bacterium B1221]|nr:tetratricopeptide repeat protein [Kiritimatiellaeota bacterium B1221]